MQEHLIGKDLEIHIVWTKVLKGDTRALAEQRAAEMAREGLHQYWDRKQAIGKALLAAPFDFGESPLAWDVYFFFDRDATWEEEEGLPEIALWTHQLGGADPHWAAGGRIGEILANYRRAMCGTQEERAEGAVEFLRRAGTYDAEWVGEGGDKSATYRAYERLRDLAPQERLIELCSDKRPIVRVYAMQALAERYPGPHLLPLGRAHLADHEEVATFWGCIMDSAQAGDLMLRFALDGLLPPERSALLEAVLGSELELRSRVLREETFPADWQLRLLGLAMEGDDDALVALARLGNAEDWIPIEEAIRERASPSALHAAALLPDPRLLPALEKIPSAARGGPFFRALAAQKSEAAARILAGEIEARSAVDLTEAIEAHLIRPHAPLLWKLWRQGATLQPPTIRYLASMDENAARAEAGRVLLTRLGEQPEEVLSLLLGLQSDERQIDLLRTTLEKRIVNDAIAHCVAERKHASFVEPLFGCLGETNPHLFLPSARALLAYEDPAITARLRTAVAGVPHLREGWGGEELAELLRE